MERIGRRPVGHSRLSGRTMARIGLRMMPPFPSSPLSFRTADFLRSGWKAGNFRRGLPVDCEFSSRRTVCLRPSCTSLPSSMPRSESRDAVRWCTTVHTVSRIYPRGPRYGPGCVVLVHQRLLTPCAPLTSSPRFHRHGLYEVTSLCVSFRRLGDRRVVPCFRWLFFIDMSSSETPGAPQLPLPSSFAANAGLRPGARVSASPTILTLRFT